MNVHSIQGRLGLLLLAFSLLVILSFGATFRGLEAQKQDALIINLAGRQRMLVQQMTREAEEVERGEGEPHLQILKDASQTFNQTLNAFREGGAVPYLPGQSVQVPAAGDAKIKIQLDTINASWNTFHEALGVILSQGRASQAFQEAGQTIERISPELVTKSDLAVRLYQEASNQKVIRLRWIQGAFLVCAFILLTVGSWMIRKSVIEPLKKLGSAASRIGSGNLETEVQISGPSEIKVLGDNFEAMRSQLQSSQQELFTWTETLERRVASRTQELEALYSVSREISSQLDINQVLRSIINKTQELVGGEVVFLCTLDSQGQMMNLRATSGPEQAICRTNTPIQNSKVDQILTGEQALRCDEQTCHGYCQIMSESYRASHVAAPLRIGRQIIGALCVGSSQPDELSDESINVLTKLSNVAAVAVENARLYRDAERVATLEERQRIAAEMHDGLAQTLSFLQMTVDQANYMLETGQKQQAVEKLGRVQQGLDQVTEDTRRAIASLQESGPIQKQLQEQLATLANEISGEGFAVEWECTVSAPLLLPHEQTENIVRVMREALLNAQHHSHAGRIHLCLQRKGSDLVISVADDGDGFDPDAPSTANGRHHFGLKIMRARAARVGGHVDIQSAPGMGTQVTLSLPVDAGYET
ncbi:MAG: histidine kinase [Anaerolineales bacterium]